MTRLDDLRAQLESERDEKKKRIAELDAQIDDLHNDLAEKLRDIVRDSGGDESVIDGIDLSDTKKDGEINRVLAYAMELGGVPPEVVYAIYHTRYIVSDKSRSRFTAAQLKEWDDKVIEGKSLFLRDNAYRRAKSKPLPIVDEAEEKP